MKLSKKLKLGDLILVKDDGYQKSHLAVLLGINPASDRNVALVKWIDGKGDTSLVFISDLDKRFVPVKIEKVVPAEREIMITEMKKRGAIKYDLGFCPGPVPIKTHPSYNIWRFKYGFNGDHILLMPTYGKVLSPLRGHIFQYLRYKK